MTPRTELSRELLRPFAYPGLTILGDPEDDEEEEEEEKKGEDDEEEEENDGEEDEVPWHVTVPDSRAMRAGNIALGSDQQPKIPMMVVIVPLAALAILLPIIENNPLVG